MVFNQSLDTRRHPYLESLDLKLGPMTLVSRGDAGRLNALTEFGVNVLPNLLRYQIVDALEEPITRRVQDVLDTVNVEDIINERLPDLDGLDNGITGLPSLGPGLGPGPRASTSTASTSMASTTTASTSMASTTTASTTTASTTTASTTTASTTSSSAPSDTTPAPSG